MYRYGTQNCLTEPGDTLRSEGASGWPGWPGCRSGSCR